VEGGQEEVILGSGRAGVGRRRQWFLGAAVCGVLLLALAEVAHGEGTYELKNFNGANPDVMLESPSSTGSSPYNLNLPRRTILKVDILSANERIDIFTDRAVSPAISIWRPGRNPETTAPDQTYNVTTGGAGHINSWTDGTCQAF
jgi:hypothetical protein